MAPTPTPGTVPQRGPVPWRGPVGRVPTVHGWWEVCEDAGRRPSDLGG